MAIIKGKVEEIEMVIHDRDEGSRLSCFWWFIVNSVNMYFIRIIFLADFQLTIPRKASECAVWNCFKNLKFRAQSTYPEANTKQKRQFVYSSSFMLEF